MTLLEREGAVARKRSTGQAVNDLLRQGWQAIVQEQFARARRHFRHALRLDRENAEAWHGLGVALFRLGELPQAYEALHTALRLNPDRPEAWHALAHVADRLGYSLEALESAERALDLTRAQHRPDDVVRGLEVTVRALRHSVERLAEEMGVRLDEEGGRERLRACMRAFQEGIEAARAREYARAEARFRECVDLAPASARAWGNLGLVLMLQKRLDEAEAALQRALALRPDYEPARRNLALLQEMRAHPDRDLTPRLHQYTDLKHNAPKRHDFR